MCAIGAIALVTLQENAQKEDLVVVVVVEEEDMNAVEANRNATSVTALATLHVSVRRIKTGVTAAMKPDTSLGIVNKAPVIHHATTATRQAILLEIAPTQHHQAHLATTATSLGTSLGTAPIRPIRPATDVARLAT